MHYVEGLPLVSLPTGRPSRLARATKRAIDLAGAAFALVVLSPVLLFIAWRVKRDSDGPRVLPSGAAWPGYGAVRAPEVPHDASIPPPSRTAHVESIMDTSEAPNGNSLYKLDRDDVVTDVGTWLRKWASTSSRS